MEAVTRGNFRKFQLRLELAVERVLGQVGSILMGFLLQSGRIETRRAGIQPGHWPPTKFVPTDLQPGLRPTHQPVMITPTNATDSSSFQEKGVSPV